MWKEGRPGEVGGKAYYAVCKHTNVCLDFSSSSGRRLQVQGGICQDGR